MRKEVGSEEFYRRTNMVCLLLLIYTIVLLIFSSKIIDRAGENEIEKSYVTGGATGNVSITIGGAAAEAAVTEEEEITAVVQQPLTTGSTIGFIPKRFEIDVFHKGEFEKELVVQNPLSKTLVLKFDTNLKDFIEVVPGELTLAPGETGKVIIKFYGDTLGTVAGFVIAQGGGIKGYIPIAIDVSSSRDAGNVKVSMPEQVEILLYLLI
jgi:hypothetical protein